MTVKISELTQATALTGTEDVLLVQAGVTKRATTQVLATAALTGTNDTEDLAGVGANDLVVADLATKRRVPLTSSADVNLTGLDGGTDNLIAIFTNIGLFNITLVTESASSAAENRFAANGDTILPPNCSATFMWMSNISRWSKI